MPELVDSVQARETLHKREGILEALSELPRTKPELVDDTEHSRSTVDRAIKDLEDCAMVERIGSKYHLTPLGECFYRELQSYEETIKSISEGSRIINSISDIGSIDAAFLQCMDAFNANPKVPKSALQPVIDQLEETSRLKGFAPVVLSLFPQILEDYIVKDSLVVEVILNRSTLESLLELDQGRLRRMTEEDDLQLYETEEPLPYALWIMDQGNGSCAAIIAHENGGIQGVLMADDTWAVEWAETEYSSIKTSASEFSF